MIQVIINADDCGNNPQINAAIDEALAQRAITSTTIMANSRYLPEVHKMVDKYKEASFGIHLNLTEGPSFTNNPLFEKRGIIDEHGCFIHGNSKRCRYPDDDLKQAVKEEWEAQLYHLIVEENFEISHADGHHHCHTWPGLEGVLVELLNKYNIGKARNKYYYPSRKNSFVFLCAKLLSKTGIKPFYPATVRDHIRDFEDKKRFMAALSSHSITTTRFFGAYEIYYKKYAFHGYKNTTIELMCHPGLSDYDSEKKLVMVDALGLKKSNKYKLISYKEL